MNIPIEHNYARVEGVFIDTIALHATICGKNYESKNNFQIYHIPNVRRVRVSSVVGISVLTSFDPLFRFNQNILYTNIGVHEKQYS